jgi:peptidoglycan/LPS O-acetylase OafA/YrhL
MTGIALTILGCGVMLTAMVGWDHSPDPHVGVKAGCALAALGVMLAAFSELAHFFPPTV